MTRHNAIIIASLLALTAATASALDTSYYAATSRLASGKWVKLRVATTGIQEVDDATLRALGFSNPDNVAVYGYGGTLLLDDLFTTAHPDDLPRQMAMHANGKLLFYGQAAKQVELSGTIVNAKQSPYSNYGFYFLTDAPRPGDVLPEAIACTPAATAVDTHTAAYVVERDVKNYDFLGERWFDNMLESDTPTSYRFPLTDAVDKASFRLTLAWGTEATETLAVALAPTVEVTNTSGLNAKPSGFTRRVGYTDFTLGAEAADTLAVDITLTTARPSGNFVAMDYAALSFARLNTLGGDAQRTMLLAAPDGANASFSSLPDGAQVWDVASAANVRPYVVADGQITPAAASTWVVAFDPAAEQHRPEVVAADLAPQDLHACATPQMLIVTVPELLPQAEQLAQLHRDLQGLDVLVVNADLVYNEFSSGGFSAIGLRRFIKMLYDRDPQRLRSLLLYGYCSSDMRHITHGIPILPIRECSNDDLMYSGSQSYCTDSYFAMLSDNYTQSQIMHQYPLIAVGRLPVYTPEQAIVVNDKIRRHMTTPNWQRAANSSIFIADNADDGQYHQGIDPIANNIATRKGDITHKDYVDFFPNDYSTPEPLLNRTVREHIENGAGFVHYMGHASYGGLVSGSYAITSGNILRYTNETMPIFIFSTCNLARIDGPHSCLGFNSLLADNGAIAAIVYTRESWANGNQISHTIFGNHLAAVSGHTTLGELWLRIRPDCVKANATSTRYGINDLNRNVFGDPELPLHFPEWEVALSLGDGAVTTTDDSGATLTELPALTPIKVSGIVRDAEGNAVADFNGTVQLQVTAEGMPRTTRGLRDADAKGMTYQCGSVPLTKAGAAVANGSFEATLVVPAHTVGSALRVVAYAETADEAHSAAGELEGLALADAAATTDTTAPVVTDFYAATADNVVTRSTDKFHAVIAPDPSGIAVGAIPLTTALRLSVDGLAVGNTAGRSSVMPDGSVAVDVPVGNLADGRHTATLSVSDNAGNRSESSITFMVATADVAATLACTSAVARDEALFEWTHTYISDEPQLTIVITDRDGRTVANTALSAADGSWAWNLRNLNGEYVANGTYTAALLATDGLRFTSSAPVDFTVLR